MHLSVEQALSIYPLSEGRLIAGRNGAVRIVKSVNVMDAPDSGEWIKEGEMLFTTASMMKDCPHEAVELLRRLDAVGSAGLGIQLGRCWPAVPEPIVEEADRLEFPLIELPLQFTLTDQINGLFHAQLEPGVRPLRQLPEKQKKLMQFALSSSGEADFFGRVLGIIGCPYAVIGSRGQIVFNATAYPDLQLLEGWPWDKDGRELPHWSGGCFPITLQYKQESVGSVLFFLSESLLLKEEEGLLHQTAELIAHQMGHICKDALERSLNKDFAELFVRYLNRQAPIEMLTDYAEDLGIRVLCGSYQTVLTKVTAGLWKEKLLLKEVRNEFECSPVFRDMEVVHFLLEDGLFSVFRADSLEHAGKLPVLLTRALEFVVNKAILPQIRVSVSAKKIKPCMLRQSYMECADALELSGRLGMPDQIVQFGSIELAYVFQQLSKEKMKAYCEEVLSQLLAKDPEYSREMLRTLEVFLEHDGQVNEAAKQLFVHRNTAAYRLEKISEILGVDFKKINDLLRLKLAFVFRRMLEEETLRAQ